MIIPTDFSETIIGKQTIGFKYLFLIHLRTRNGMVKMYIVGMLVEK